MSILSASVSLTRYQVDGELEKPVLDSITNGLVEHTFKDHDESFSETEAGWTSFETPYLPDFSGSSFVFGTYLVFSLRLDRKAISPGIIKKHVAIEMARQLENNRRPFLSREEKQAIKDRVVSHLIRRIPATPHIYELVWHVEDRRLWFFTNLKAPNQALVTLFIKSFGLGLIRLFPYTTAEIAVGLSDPERDRLVKLTPTKFTV